MLDEAAVVIDIGLIFFFSFVERKHHDIDTCNADKILCKPEYTVHTDQCATGRMDVSASIQSYGSLHSRK